MTHTSTVADWLELAKQMRRTQVGVYYTYGRRPLQQGVVYDGSQKPLM